MLIQELLLQKILPLHVQPPTLRFSGHCFLTNLGQASFKSGSADIFPRLVGIQFLFPEAKIWVGHRHPKKRKHRQKCVKKHGLSQLLLGEHVVKENESTTQKSVIFWNVDSEICGAKLFPSNYRGGFVPFKGNG